MTAVAVVGQPLASPSTETPPAPASSHRSDDAKDGGGGAAHPHAQGGSTTSITSITSSGGGGGGDADVWLYDADGQIVATDVPQDESPPQVPVWYTEAAEEAAEVDTHKEAGVSRLHSGSIVIATSLTTHTIAHAHFFARSATQ